MDSLKGKVVIITGAGSGFGRETALYLCKIGCRLSLVDKNEESLKIVKLECEGIALAPALVLCIVADVLEDEQRKDVIKKTVQSFGQIDVLVNNAGGAGMGNVSSLTEEELIKSFKLNTVAPLRLSQLAIPYLQETKGNIVNVSSIGSEEPVPIAAGYCMSKAALDMQTKLLAVHLCPSSVRVNSIHPCYVAGTQFLQTNLNYTDEQAAEAGPKTRKLHPLGDVKPEDVAKSIAVLASDLSRMTTGQKLYVSAGRNCLAPEILNEAIIQNTS